MRPINILISAFNSVVKKDDRKSAYSKYQRSILKGPGQICLDCTSADVWESEETCETIEMKFKTHSGVVVLSAHEGS
jgi:hypothetical protein